MSDFREDRGLGELDQGYKNFGDIGSKYSGVEDYIPTGIWLEEWIESSMLDEEL